MKGAEQSPHPGVGEGPDPGHVGARSGLSTPSLDHWGWACWGLLGLLTAWVYRGLVLNASGSPFAAELEGWFFAPSDTSAPLVLILAGWMFWRRHWRLDGVQPRPAVALGGVLLGLAVTTLAWAYYTAAADLQVVSLGFLASGTVALRWGLAGLRAFWVPLLFLFFALPLPPIFVSTVIWPLQLWTAEYAGWLLYLIGQPVFVQGDLLQRPESTFMVIETCSGMRSIETLTMLAVLLVDLFDRHRWHAALLVVAAPFVAFALNGLRVLSIILNPHSDVSTVHNLQGIIVLLVGVTLLYLVDGAIERFVGAKTWAELRDEAEQKGRDRGGEAVSRLNSWVTSRPAVAPGVVLVALVACVVSPFVTPRWTKPLRHGATLEATLAAATAGWPSREIKQDYMFRGDTWYQAMSQRRYLIDGAWVEIFVGIGDHSERRYTAFSPKTRRPGSGYRLIEERVTQLADDLPRVDWLLLRKNNDDYLAFGWNEGDRGLLREMLRHWLALDRSLFARERPGRAFRVSSPLGDIGDAESVAKAEARLRKALRRILPSLEAI